MHDLSSLTPQSVAHSPAAPASPESLSETQTFRPQPDLLNQNRHFK